MVPYLTNSSNTDKLSFMWPCPSQHIFSVLWNNFDLALLRMKHTCQLKNFIFHSEHIYFWHLVNFYLLLIQNICICTPSNWATKQGPGSECTGIYCVHSKRLFSLQILINVIARWCNNTTTGKCKQNWYKNLLTLISSTLCWLILSDEFCVYPWQSEILKKAEVRILKFFAKLWNTIMCYKR